GKQNCLKLAT
nr:Chain E, synthetic peptide [synthetic construct]